MLDQGCARAEKGGPARNFLTLGPAWPVEQNDPARGPFQIEQNKKI